jgi:hypothetical protein
MAIHIHKCWWSDLVSWFAQDFLGFSTESLKSRKHKQGQEWSLCFNKMKYNILQGMKYIFGLTLVWVITWLCCETLKYTIEIL